MENTAERPAGAAAMAWPRLKRGNGREVWEDCPAFPAAGSAARSAGPRMAAAVVPMVRVRGLWRRNRFAWDERSIDRLRAASCELPKRTEARWRPKATTIWSRSSLLGHRRLDRGLLERLATGDVCLIDASTRSFIVEATARQRHATHSMRPAAARACPKAPISRIPRSSSKLKRSTRHIPLHARCNRIAID